MLNSKDLPPDAELLHVTDTTRPGELLSLLALLLAILALVFLLLIGLAVFLLAVLLAVLLGTVVAALPPHAARGAIGASFARNDDARVRGPARDRARDEDSREGA